MKPTRVVPKQTPNLASSCCNSGLNYNFHYICILGALKSCSYIIMTILYCKICAACASLIKTKFILIKTLTVWRLCLAHQTKVAT